MRFRAEAVTLTRLLSISILLRLWISGLRNSVTVVTEGFATCAAPWRREAANLRNP